MILVEKPIAPAKLSDGDQLTQDYCSTFELNPDPYRSGLEKFEIGSNIYNHETVKDVLREAHHRKCCFCESVFEANTAADIEHFRPKAYSQQGKGSQKIYPGYYWLAYSWDNLFYCCPICNRSHKKNYFPLRAQGMRARCHLDDLSLEEPLLLNPSGPMDPRDHIHFYKEVAIGVTEAGETTIDIVGLNRSSLSEERLKRYKELWMLHSTIRLLRNCESQEARNMVDDAQAVLRSADQPNAEFSAMASDFINENDIF